MWPRTSPHGPHPLTGWVHLDPERPPHAQGCSGLGAWLSAGFTGPLVTDYSSWSARSPCAFRLFILCSSLCMSGPRLVRLP